MAGWVEPPLLELELWYGDLLVALLHRVFPHQGTWFAEYELCIRPGQGELPGRLLAYIAFCDDFNRRLAADQELDFTEFNRFVPIAEGNLWIARFPNGGPVPMEGQLLFSEGQVSWQHPRTEPSTESAANEFWGRHSQHAGVTPTG